MQKTKSMPLLRVAISAVLTTSVLLACAPAQQNTQQQSQDLQRLGEPARDKKRLDHEQVTADAVSQQNRLLAAEQMISPMPGLVTKSLHSFRAPTERTNRENYFNFDDNQIKLVTESPVSTFSIDVDTGSYSNVRRMINAGNLPRKDAVRVEEMINYFSYDYPLSENKNIPFSVNTEVAVTPWNANTRLLHIGINAYDIADKDVPAANLVFLIDVSGSMNSANKLGLLKSSLKLLSSQMRAEDKISIVVYAGASGVVLEPVAGNQTAKIVQALDALSAGGSTNGGAGIRSAYQLAQQAFIKDGINRIILVTDGDFNVGTVNFEALKDLVEEKRKTGISLTTLGFGTGNYNDHLMEQLAAVGNGNYSYIDTLNEAQKVLVDEMHSTLNIVAKDVKIQIEFNPAVVAEYRLIGYENRTLKRQDFNNDKVDAGEIGSGHSVTALYEITLTSSKYRAVDSLRYSVQEAVNKAPSNELAHLRLRYKVPTAKNSQLIEQAIYSADIEPRLVNTSERYRFSAAVAGFGQLLRGGVHSENFTYDDVLELARKSRGSDNFGYRGEFVSLVNLAKSLSAQATSSPEKEKIQASR